ncbi:VOC family protein [Tunturibacter empetritectus]|uniref:PhnB protein n=1 Tax=Tunturiibacter empetritectus TaxID=3069691 RepID=A0A7W8IFG7_9BACT|nr:VOC family protein [Edaphobacter lichenicola]MBB5316254.1 PhnB protein [Edaphobacter lichenicola]
MESYPPLIPYLVVRDAAAAIDFYKNALGAMEIVRHHMPESTKITHAHLVIGDGSIMLSDDFPEMRGGKASTPEALGGSPVTIHLQMNDVDRFWKRAVEHGVIVTMPLADQFWGDRYGQFQDPFGHKWSVGHTKISLSEDQLKEAARVWFKI